MGDSEENNKQTALIPSWQQAASKPAEDSDSRASTPESVLEQARRFLQDETVRDSSREKKVEFLKSKGLEKTDITGLLDELGETTPQPPASTPQETPSTPPPASIPVQPTPGDKASNPPIVTYPEFLTKPLKPPPLITASGLLNSLGLVAGLSTLVYGATKYLASPMVESLTEARVDFHQTANKNLTRLVEKLEGSVSELPAGYHAITGNRPAAIGPPPPDDPDDADDSSAYDDPSELFHRDVGVQTSPPPPLSPPSTPGGGFPSANSTHTPASAADRVRHQADRLARLSAGVRGLAADVVHQAEDTAETKNVLDQFGSDLHNLTWPPEAIGVGSSYLYGSQRNEPDDEIKKVKMNIRGVKGVLLSTRSFPATTR